jgi:hypothetical protein
MMFIRNLLSTWVHIVLALAFLAVAIGHGEEQVHPEGITTVQLGGQLSEAILEYVINRADARAGGLDTVTMTYSVPQEAWIAIGFTNGDGLMVGSETVIGLPESGEVKKYFMGSYENSGIVPMPEEQQTLIEATVVQEDGNTKMHFTKILNETGEIPIAIGANTFIGAFGFTNMFFVHNKRDSFDIDLVAGEIELVETRNRVLWKAHGWCAALAWGFLSPIAIGVAMLRYWFPDGLWLTIHQYLNYSVVVLTIMAFAFGVAAIQSETPAGGDALHFSASHAPHRLIGLVLFLLVVFQTVAGQFRPHNPAKGEKKSLTRRSWEVLHKILGRSLLAIAWYQVQSGIQLYQNLFADSAATNLSAIFWGLVGTITGISVVGVVVTKFVKKTDKTDKKESATSEFEELESDSIAGAESKMQKCGEKL